MKLFKFLIFFKFISLILSYKETKKNGLKSLKRIDQKYSGICGFVTVLEAALDLGVQIKGKSTNDEFQDYLPLFIEDFLKYLKSNKTLAFEKIFKETQEYMVTILKKNKSKWYKSSERMLTNIKDRMLKSTDYSKSLGLYLSFDNLKEVAEYAKLSIDSSRGSKTKLAGSLLLDNNIDNLKNLNKCIIGVSNCYKTFWNTSDSQYDFDKKKNKVTRHWIYVTKDKKLKNWNETCESDKEYTEMIEKMVKIGLNTISEALCFK